MQKLRSLVRCGLVVAAAAWSVMECRAGTILAANSTAVSTSSQSYSEVEVGLFFPTPASPSTRVTGMRLWFPSAGLQNPVTAVFRDGDGSNAGTVTGASVRNDGLFTVYEFSFGSSLAQQSGYYAGYDFRSSGNPIALGATTDPTIMFDAALLTGAEYASVLPDPFQTDPPTSTSGNYPRFEVIGVPEPSTFVLALAGLACGGYRIGRRRNRCSCSERVS